MDLMIINRILKNLLIRRNLMFQDNTTIVKVILVRILTIAKSLVITKGEVKVDFQRKKDSHITAKKYILEGTILLKII